MVQVHLGSQKRVNAGPNIAARMNYIPLIDENSATASLNRIQQFLSSDSQELHDVDSILTRIPVRSRNAAQYLNFSQSYVVTQGQPPSQFRGFSLRGKELSYLTNYESLATRNCTVNARARVC